MCLTSGVIVKKAAFSDFRQYEVDYSAETWKIDNVCSRVCDDWDCPYGTAMQSKKEA